MRRDLAIAGLLVLAVAAVYGPGARHEFVIYDDPAYVYENPHVAAGLSWDGLAWAFTATRQSNWHPLTWLSHMLDCQLFGLWAGGHHLVSAAIHAANSVLLYLVLKRMTARLPAEAAASAGAASAAAAGLAKAGPWPSAAVAALFALHPLHVESVAWAAERKDVLSALFGLLALLAYARYAERPGVLRYVPVFILLALGLMAKPMLVTLPFVMLLLDFWPLGRLTGNAECGVRNAELTAKSERFAFSLRTPHSALRIAVEKLPLLALSAASSVITYYVQQAGGAMSLGQAIPFQVRAGNAVLSYVKYLIKTFCPTRLAVQYPFGPDEPPWQVVSAGALLAAVTVAVVLLARRRPYLAVGWFWYVGMLVPVIGLVQVGEQAMADRYTYLPLVGVFIALVWLGADLAARQGRLKPLPVPGACAGVAAAFLAACGVFAAGQVAHWSDTESLLSHALAVTENNGLAHCTLGAFFSEEGKWAGAEMHFRKALAINPYSALTQNNLGYALLRQGRVDEAAQRFRAAIAIKPHYPLAHNNLATALARKGNLDGAAAHFREAIRQKPDYAHACYNLGRILAEQGDQVGAVAAYRDAIKHEPAFASAYHHLGRALVRLGRHEEAAAALREAVRLAPDLPGARDDLQAALRPLGPPK
ncbi:MAG: tetratricopeptide repeat protein [Planctomycetes bacterium]|nr:tetratricopeptide repeat protein [Planctomycetota bacterium]